MNYELLKQAVMQRLYEQNLLEAEMNKAASWRENISKGYGKAKEFGSKAWSSIKDKASSAAKAVDPRENLKRAKAHNYELNQMLDGGTRDSLHSTSRPTFDKITKKKRMEYLKAGGKAAGIAGAGALGLYGAKKATMG